MARDVDTGGGFQVVMTPHGETYHRLPDAGELERAACKWAENAEQSPVDEEDAIEQGYTRCKNCNWISVAERFWQKVDRGASDECWTWEANRNLRNYGTFAINRNMFQAHRVAFMLEREDPGDEWVLHKCDNPPCVNPDHLYLGTPSDNMQDAWDRGRKNATGSKNPHSVLTEPVVAEIKARLEDGEQQNELAEEYGVGKPTVNDIANERTWTHVDPENHS